MSEQSPARTPSSELGLFFDFQNMVGAGEVDEDLEVETKEECEKYGKVGKCVIFEVRDNLCLFLAALKVNWTLIPHNWSVTA